MEGTIIRVALYGRVSTEEQAEHGYSIQAQVDMGQQHCGQTGKQIVDIYLDRGFSGKEMSKRLELKRLLKDAEAGLFDEVVVWKINRLSRKMKDLLEIVERLNKYNVSFRSLTENFETETPMGRFALQMMGAVGELERNTIVENVKMGMKQRARTGKWNGGAVLGYDSIETSEMGRKGKLTRLEIVPEEAVIIRKIYDWYTSGRGFKSIANQLNREGYRTKKGNPFGTSSIKEILLNPLYAGNIRYNRFEGWSEKRRRGKSDNAIICEGQHEGIIDIEQWEKAQALLKEKAKVNPKVFQGISLLSGLIRCPKCGSPMVPSRTVNYLKDGTKIVRRYYSCGRFRNQGSSVCNANSVVAEYAEQYVVNRIKQVVLKPKTLADIVAAINRKKVTNIEPLKQELQVVTTNLGQVEAKRQKIMDLYELDAVDRATLASRLDALTAEQDTLLRRKAEIECDLSDDNQQEISVEEVRILLETLDRILENSQPEQKKTFLHAAIEEISVTEDKKIGKIQLTFDEGTEKSFLRIDPSAAADGSLFLPGRRRRSRKIAVAI